MSENDSQASDDEAGGSERPSETKQSEPWIRFALIFGALAIASEAFYYAIALDSEGFVAYLAVLARLSGAVMMFLGVDVEIDGTRLSGDSFAVQVAQGCDAIQVCSLLVAAVVAFPLGFKRKLRGVLVGVASLQLLNLMRIITLYLIGVHYPNLFHTAHHFVWPGFLIAFTIAAWVFWVRWETGPPRSIEHAA